MVLLCGVGPASTLAATEPSGEYGVNFVVYGDTDCNNKINVADALQILHFSVGSFTPNEVQQTTADVNTDKMITVEDALMVLQHAVGITTHSKIGEYYIFNPKEEPVVQGYVQSYDKSNSVNGAYGKDTTADTSFVTDGTTLRENTIYSIAATVVNSNNDNARLVYSLQGLVNRDFGMDAQHTALIYVMRDDSDSGWYSYITADGTIMQRAKNSNNQQGLSVCGISSFDEFLNEFLPLIQSCGMVLWDGNVPATSNVAATICGLDGYLPVLSQSPLHTKLSGKGVETRQSLVGLFQNGKKGQAISGTSVSSTGSAKNDAYLWAMEKYFHRCSSQYLAYILDGAVTIKGYSAYSNNPIATYSEAGINCLSNMDYLIARRCFFFDLAPYKGEAACDDSAQKTGKATKGVDNATMMKIFQARYDRANGAFGQLMGFPPWWIKYTNFNSMGAKEPTWIEWLFTEYITCYNLAKEADAQAPASMTNGSVYYKYVPKTATYQNNKTAKTTTFDANTVYYTIYMGDYDSSAWLKQHVYNMWVKNGGDKRRGSLPLMWAYNPNLSYRVPMVFDYVYENKSAQDYFVAGDSGAGYIIPEGLFHDKTLPYMEQKRPSGNAAAGNLWAEYSKTFYQRFDMDITGFIINGASTKISKNIASCFNQFSAVGNFSNCPETLLGWHQGVPYVYCQNGIVVGDSKVMSDHAKWVKNQGINFTAFRTICRTPTEISTIVSEFESYAKGKSLKVKYVDPYTYFDLVRKSGQGTTIQ
jgi:hypothetical protein